MIEYPHIEAVEETENHLTYYVMKEEYCVPKGVHGEILHDGKKVTVLSEGKAQVTNHHHQVMYACRLKKISQTGGTATPGTA